MAVTGANVPGVNAGILTTALVALSTVNTNKPVPPLLASTVTKFAPVVTPMSVGPPDGNIFGSLTTIAVGVQAICARIKTAWN